MNIIEFLDLHEIKWLPIKDLVNKKVTPFDDGVAFSVKDFDSDNIKELQQKYVNESKYIGIDTKFVQQLDIDTKEHYKFYKMYNNTPFFLSSFKKLPHFFVNYKLKNKRNARNIVEGDVLCGLWSYAIKDSIVMNSDKIIYDLSVDEDILVDRTIGKSSYDNLEKKIIYEMMQRNGYDRLQESNLKYEMKLLFKERKIKELFNLVNNNRDNIRVWKKVLEEDALVDVLDTNPPNVTNMKSRISFLKDSIINSVSSINNTTVLYTISGLSLLSAIYTVAVSRR